MRVLRATRSVAGQAAPVGGDGAIWRRPPARVAARSPDGEPGTILLERSRAPHQPFAVCSGPNGPRPVRVASGGGGTQNRALR